MTRSNPERDRRLAGEPRYQPRRAQELGDLVKSFMRSDEVRRMKRFQAVAAALAEVVPAERLAKVRPVSIAAGVLTLEVADAVLMAELRAHHQAALVASLTAHGAAANRIQWRLARA